ncbi:MAG TPA: cytochrome c oxidase subunit II [Acidimicrobiia bacterium]|nr:cytochrome c oxidase subunit II [Acidimicrobiia bacterium]
MALIRRHLLRLAVLVGSSFLLSACAIIEVDENPLTTFEPAGPFADRIDSLFWLVFWIATAIFILVMGGLVVVVIFFRDKGKDGEEGVEPKQLHGSPKLEVLWTVIPALILAGIAVPTVASVFQLTECEPDAMEVEITGHQWWFEFHYPEQNIDTANVLVIPVDQEVCARMTSDDVIHSFWVPALNGKRDVVPGQTTLLRLQADEPGEYWGHCAEFCGLSHSLMRTRVQALSQTNFDQWVVNQQAPAKLAVEGDPGYEGYQVYANKGCTQCHTVRFDDEEASNIIAPDAFNGPELTHFASREVFAGASLPEQGESHDEALKRWLADPPAVKPGSFMPDLALTEAEIEALIVWLDSNE